MENEADPFEFAAEPTCAVCGTVLHAEGAGYRCRDCGLPYLRNYSGHHDGSGPTS